MIYNLLGLDGKNGKLLSLASGCSAFPKNARQEVSDYILARYPDAMQINISNLRSTPQGKIIDYSYELPPEAPHLGTYSLGVAVVNRSNRFPGNWLITKNTVFSSSGKPIEGELIRYASLQGNFTAIFADVLSEKVIAVEAVQDDGEFIREDVAEPFVKLFTDGNGKTFYEIRVIGDDEDIIKTFILESDRCPENR